MITLDEITVENFDEVIALTVAPEQTEFVCSNVESIAQSKVMPECVPLAVCADGKPVGFAMYCLDRDDGEWWIYRLMVDRRFQGQGYGRAALAALLPRMDSAGGKEKIFLGVHRADAAAVALYESLGFRFDGRIFGAEHIMVLER